MTLERVVILNPSTVTLSPSYVILNEVKNLRAGSAKSLRTSSVKDLWQNDPLPTGCKYTGRAGRNVKWKVDGICDRPPRLRSALLSCILSPAVRDDEPCPDEGQPNRR